MEQHFQQLHMPRLVTGRGSLSFFATLGKKRIGVIRGGRSYSPEVRHTVESLAAQTGAQVRYLAQIRNEPLIEDIFTATEAVREFQPDLILAIGGGSVSISNTDAELDITATAPNADNAIRSKDGKNLDEVIQLAENGKKGLVKLVKSGTTSISRLFHNGVYADSHSTPPTA